MKYRKLSVALLASALSCLSINTVSAQTSGIPSPIDGQPITDTEEPIFNLGFGNDDRIPMTSSAYPWSAVGRIQIDGGGHCTGALVARDLVLTNAHCIWSNGQRRNIMFAPNYKNGQSPETVRGTYYWWGTENPNQYRNADWAIIRLERPIGDQYGWFGWQPLNYQELQGRAVSYVGYSTFANETVPAFVNGETAQVHVGCQVRDVYADAGIIHTDCDNGRGGSGGPIFTWQNNQPTIIGINAAEYRSDPDGESYFAQNYIPGRGNISVPTLTFAQAIREASSASSPQLASADLCWYQHRGWQDGSASWASNNCTEVGSGWNFRTVFASSDGVIYGINDNSELLWYKHNGWQEGSASWASGTGTRVGSGWNFRTVFASSGGVVYGIKDNGELCWYKHNGWQNGSASWTSDNCTKVGSGWNMFKTVFASSDGVIYGIKDNGDLHWYKHDGWQEGSSSFAQGSGTKVGSSWNMFKAVFASSDGVIYGIKDNGDLHWYKHDGWQEGSSSFARGSGTKVGSGWNFRSAFAASNGTIYGVVR